MVGLHALHGGDKETTTSQVVALLLGGDAALDGTARPEGVGHRAPGVLGVGSKVGGTILSDGEARCLPGDLQVDDAVRVDSRLDGVGVTLLVESDGQVIGAEADHLLIKHEVRQAIRVPDVVSSSALVKDLSVEVGGGMDASIVPHKASLVIFFHHFKSSSANGWEHC